MCKELKWNIKILKINIDKGEWLEYNNAEINYIYFINFSVEKFISERRSSRFEERINTKE